MSQRSTSRSLADETPKTQSWRYPTQYSLTLSELALNIILMQGWRSYGSNATSLVWAKAKQANSNTRWQTRLSVLLTGWRTKIQSNGTGFDCCLVCSVTQTHFMYKSGSDHITIISLSPWSHCSAGQKTCSGVLPWPTLRRRHFHLCGRVFINLMLPAYH